MLTADKLFDGTITTGMEQYYIEPSTKYTEELHKNGVHTIIYKLSDVKMDVHKHNKDKSDHETHCESEKLYRRMRMDSADDDDDDNINRNFLYKVNENEKSDNHNSDSYNNKLKLSNNSEDDDEDIISSYNQGNADTALKRTKRWVQVSIPWENSVSYFG